MILRANCKINIGLDILRRREDGYHDLATVMYPVAGLYDEVEVTRTSAAGAKFRAEGLAVDCAPDQNLCLKAFRLMHERYGVDGVRIRLDKRVPFGAGLGGGSSDATAVLLALLAGRSPRVAPSPRVPQLSGLARAPVHSDRPLWSDALPSTFSAGEHHRPPCTLQPSNRPRQCRNTVRE